MQSNQPALRTRSQPAGVAVEDDVTLARQARADPQAFAELYRRHLQPIYRFHLIRTSNVEDAQDLTSQTFLAALESIESYRGQGSFVGWLFGIASHKVADHYRRRRVSAPLEAVEDLTDPEPHPEEVAATRLQLRQVARALATLAPDQAEALTLRLSGGLSALEVGRIMGRSEAAVKMLVHRGLRNLQDRLVLELEVS
jgi:RNA polymerase sigma-70 factor (ECF subfamily)